MTYFTEWKILMAVKALLTAAGTALLVYALLGFFAIGGPHSIMGDGIEFSFGYRHQERVMASLGAGLLVFAFTYLRGV